MRVGRSPMRARTTPDTEEVQTAPAVPRRRITPRPSRGTPKPLRSAGQAVPIMPSGSPSATNAYIAMASTARRGPTEAMSRRRLVRAPGLPFDHLRHVSGSGSTARLELVVVVLSYQSRAKVNRPGHIAKGHPSEPGRQSDAGQPPELLRGAAGLAGWSSPSPPSATGAARGPSSVGTR